jgi:hypothetical protein
MNMGNIPKRNVFYVVHTNLRSSAAAFTGVFVLISVQSQNRRYVKIIWLKLESRNRQVS